MTAQYFDVPADLIAELSTGSTPTSVLDLLQNVQLSKRLLLMRAIVSTQPSRFAEAVRTLARAEQHGSDAVRDVLCSPWVGAWASRTARRLRGVALSRERLDTTLDEDLNHLHRVAAHAAAAAGLAEFDAPRPAPLLRASYLGATISVTIEDRDRYRDCFQMAMAGPLPPEAVERWREIFTEAWQLLTTYVPVRATELRLGLRSLAPLAGLAGAPGLSATSHDAYGGFALTEPTDAPAFATTMIHEFQHSKLSALLDLVTLYDKRSTERHFAPWRQDPRPIGGLLQGVYAFLAVADAWHALRSAPGLAERAETQFAELVTQLQEAVPVLCDSAALTVSGRQFAEGLSGWLSRLSTAPVRPRVAGKVRRTFLETKATWQLRHGITPTVARSRS
jgi:uncharacterized protein